MKNIKLVIVGLFILFLTIIKFPVMGIHSSAKLNLIHFLGPLLIALVIYLLPLYFVAKDKKWAKVTFSLVLLLTLFMGGRSETGFVAATCSKVLQVIMIVLLLAHVLATIVWFILLKKTRRAKQ
jgi:hypothetical protein